MNARPRALWVLLIASAACNGAVCASARGADLAAALAELAQRRPRFRLISCHTTPGAHEVRFFYTTGVGTDHEIMERVNVALPIDGRPHQRPERGWPMVALFHGLGGGAVMGSALARADGIAAMGITLHGQGQKLEDRPVPINGGVYPGDTEAGGKGWFTEIGGLKEQNSVKEVITFLLDNFDVFGIDGGNMAVNGGSYGGIMSWMSLSMDLSDVSWKWRTGIVSTFVNPGDGCLYPNFLHGDDETRFAVRHGYSANTWLKTTDCEPPYGPMGRVLRAEDIDPASGTVQVQFDDEVQANDPRVVGRDFVFGALAAPIVSNTPTSVTLRTDDDLEFVRRSYKFPERCAISSPSAPSPRVTGGPWRARFYRAARDRDDWDSQWRQITDRAVYLPEDVAKDRDPDDPDVAHSKRYRQLLRNVTSRALFFKQAARGHWFTAQGHERLRRSLLRNGFFVRWQLQPRDHGGYMYDPNYVSNGTKVVWRLNDRYFDERVDLGKASASLVTDDLGAGPVWSRCVATDMRRWLRYWLKGEDNGIVDEPPICFIAPNCRPGETPDPDTGYEAFRLDDYPGTHIVRREFFLGSGGRVLTERPESNTIILRNRVTSPEPEDLLWVPVGEGTVRHELIFNSGPLPSDLVLMGTPEARLSVFCNAAEFAMTISIYDVTIDERGNERNADLITRGPAFRFVKATGELMELDVECDFRVHRFERGHILRIVAGNLDHLLPQRGSFNFWSAPSFVPSDTTIRLGGEDASVLRLPVFVEASQ